MHWSVAFKLQLHYLVFSTISLVICFTTMSVIRNFLHTAQYCTGKKPFLQQPLSHCCLPCSGLKHLLPTSPQPFFLPFFRYSKPMLLNLGLQALSSKPCNFMAGSIHFGCEASYILTHWMGHTWNGLPRWPDPAASDEALSDTRCNVLQCCSGRCRSPSSSLHPLAKRRGASLGQIDQRGHWGGRPRV